MGWHADALVRSERSAFEKRIEYPRRCSAYGLIADEGVRVPTKH